MIYKQVYIHKLEEEAFDDMINSSFFSDEIMDYYKNFEEKIRRPDLLGKTVRVTEKQFNKIYKQADLICKELNMEIPDMYIYEDFYYGIESKGSSKPWIEISAKTIEDFEEEEFKFLLARSLCSINLKHTYYKTMIEQTIESLEGSNFDFFSKGVKANVYRWYRIINYTCDNFGYLICKDLDVCTQAIMKTILNSKFLASSVNIKEYINQSVEINILNDVVYNFTKADEKVPYGPFRIKNLISYISSKRCIDCLKEGGVKCQ